MAVDFVFSLAHYCEIHGPTSVFCTQAIPEPCSTCPADLYPSPQSLPFLIESGPSFQSTLSGHGLPFGDYADQASSSSSGPTIAATPPTQDTKRDNAWHRFGGIQNNDTDSCASCSFDVPKHVSQRLPNGAPGSPVKGSDLHRHGSPVIRTRGSVPAQCDDSCPPNTYNDHDGEPTEAGATSTPPHTSSDPITPASTSPHSSRPPSTAPISIPNLSHSHHHHHHSTRSRPSTSHEPHIHTLQYLTTRHPTSSALYSALRQSIIRTLSLETLPRGTASGPLLFSTPATGAQTIAFIFRLPDPRARGHRRTYALLALSSQDAARAAKAMSRITRFFARIASWITGLAERRVASLDDNAGPARPADSQQRTDDPSLQGLMPVSSFLTARRPDPDGGARRRPQGSARESGPAGAKGLAEIAGHDALFVELHVQFVQVLAMLGREFGVCR